MQDLGPNNWFYINVMLDHSELFIPLPEQSSGELEQALNSKLRGVALRWDQLRVGYFFGGDGEKILRVNAHELSMIGRLPEVVHSQVWHLAECEDLETELHAHFLKAVRVTRNNSHVPLVSMCVPFNKHFLLAYADSCALSACDSR